MKINSNSILSYSEKILSIYDEQKDFKNLTEKKLFSFVKKLSKSLSFDFIIQDDCFSDNNFIISKSSIYRIKRVVECIKSMKLNSSYLNNSLSVFKNSRSKTDKRREKDFIISFLDEIFFDALYIKDNYPTKSFGKVFCSDNVSILDSNESPLIPFHTVNFTKDTKSIIKSLS